MSTKLGEIKNAETGETIVEVIGPATAASNGDALSLGLYALSEIIIRGLHPDEDDGGGMGGRFGYACEFENDVFALRPDYQGCSCPLGNDGWEVHAEDCRFMLQLPNFKHKASGLEVNWYKWIGRDMEISNPDLTLGEWEDIWNQCRESLPTEARQKAEAESKADAEREADPEYQRQRAAMQEAMFKHMQEIHDTCEREGHDDATGHCKRCGLITDFERGFASIRAERET